MTPRTEAIAYRIYWHCDFWGWNRTIREIAESLGEPYHDVRAAIRAKKWSGRVKILHYRKSDVTEFLWGENALSNDVPMHMILEQYA